MIASCLSRGLRVVALSMLFIMAFGINAAAQDRLPDMPGHDRYVEMLNASRGLSVTNWQLLEWAEDGRSFIYREGDDTYRFDIRRQRVTETEPPERRRPVSAIPEEFRVPRPARARQFTTTFSTDFTMKAFYRDNNLWISDPDGSNERPVTTEGSRESRVKYGNATWTYGEELRQNTAMWWSPDGSKLAYYRFDETGIDDYYVLHNHLNIQNRLAVEPYVKVGARNPLVDLYIYDLDSDSKTKIDVRSGEPFTRDVPGHYVYSISWCNNGEELLFHRTNRRQNIMEFCAANPRTGEVRVIIREEWLPSYTTNTPMRRYLDDQERFIWQSERNGFRNYYLYDMSGRMHAALTNHDFEVAGIVKIDERDNKLYYMARSGDNHMKLQLHVVGLDGSGDTRLTDPAWHHSVSIAPDNRHFIDTYQTYDTPPRTRLVDMRGRVVADLGEPDMTRFNELGLKKVEQFRYMAADGVSELHGTLHFPSQFDPSKRYPVLFTVYGGPGSSGARETFTRPNILTEYGFLVVQLTARNTSGRGKAFSDPFYGNLGIVEIDDFAAGMRSLGDRPYFNSERVGVFGTSYGGTVAAMCLLRYPDLFHAAVASAAVTDWRNYDSIYTERYFGLLEENEEGYNRGNVNNYAENLEGNLMIFYGTRDDNVHISNSYQLITALQRAGKHFEVQVGPDRGHVGLGRDRMMEFFIYHLVMN